MALTSDGRRPDQTSASNVRFGWREAELTWYGSISLRGVKHGWTEISRRGVVHLEEEEEEEGSEIVKYLSSFLDGFPVPQRMNPAQFGDPTVRLSEISELLLDRVTAGSEAVTCSAGGP